MVRFKGGCKGDCSQCGGCPNGQNNNDDDDDDKKDNE